MVTHPFLSTEALDLVQQEFAVRKHRRPRYSLRAFARDLSVSPSTLSDFLSGRQGLSVDTALDMAKKFKYNDSETHHFLDLVTIQSSRSKSDKEAARVRVQYRLKSQKAQLSNDNFQLIAEWYHFAILELIDMGPENHSISALCKSLKITKEQCTQALERLERVQLLTREEKEWQTLTPHTYVGEGTPSEAIRLFHQQILEKALHSLKKDALEDREFQSVLTSIDAADFASLKAEIEKTWRKLLMKYSTKTNKKQLIALSMQLFKINKP